MENVLNKNLDELLQGFGDPFQFTQHLLLRDGSSVNTVDCEPKV